MKSTKKFRFLVLLLVAILFAQNARATVIDFEDLTLGATYNVGDSFTTSGVVITAEQFQWSNGTWYAGGYARVENGGLADGAGNELHTNNINLNFDFGIILTGLALQYGEFGGNLNININGSFVNFENFDNIDNTTIGGVSVFTLDTGTPGDSSGAMFAVGEIETFVLGGQELWLDNVVASPIPEPATLALFGIGALITLTRKRRSA